MVGHGRSAPHGLSPGGVTRMLVALALVLVALALPGGATSGVAGSQDGAPPSVVSAPIIGGTEVDPPGEYPFVAYVVASGSACGGSLIAPTYVVTAAHCVVDGISVTNPATVSVVIGRHDLGTSDGEVLGVRRISVPPAWRTSGADDIAVLELDTPSRFGTPVDVADPSDAAAWTAGAQARVLGWGATDPGGRTPSATLQELDLEIQTDDLCAAIWFGYEPANEICAGGIVNEDGCLGDSGGPLVVPGVDSSWLLVGIVSAGPFPCADGFPGIYTEVASYLDVLEAATGIDFTPPAPPIESAASGSARAVRLSLGR